MDGDGLPNGEDDDVDGDGLLNGEDEDIDGDGVPNNEDDDAYGDGGWDGVGPRPDTPPGGFSAEQTAEMVKKYIERFQHKNK